jgi:hypothetical protein
MKKQLNSLLQGEEKEGDKNVKQIKKRKNGDED